MANRLSPTLRQGLLLHEIVHACGKPQKPIIDDVFPPEEVKARLEKQRPFMVWLREQTLTLGN